MLNIADLSPLRTYELFVEKLVRQFPTCWHLCGGFGQRITFHQDEDADDDGGERRQGTKRIGRRQTLELGLSSTTSGRRLLEDSGLRTSLDLAGTWRGKAKTQRSTMPSATFAMDWRQSSRRKRRKREGDKEDKDDRRKGRRRMRRKIEVMDVKDRRVHWQTTSERGPSCSFTTTPEQRGMS